MKSRVGANAGSDDVVHEKRYGETPRLRTHAVVGLGFERLVTRDLCKKGRPGVDNFRSDCYPCKS